MLVFDQQCVLGVCNSIFEQCLVIHCIRATSGTKGSECICLFSACAYQSPREQARTRVTVMTATAVAAGLRQQQQAMAAAAARQQQRPQQKSNNKETITVAMREDWHQCQWRMEDITESALC